MATAVSLLANPCNNHFDQQQHQQHQQRQLQQHCYPPFGVQQAAQETFQHRYSSCGTPAGGSRRSEATGSTQCIQLEALDFHLLSRTIEEEFEQMEYSGSSSSTFQYHPHDQQQPQQQPQQQQQHPGTIRRQGQQDFEQISSGYNLDNEDTYSGSPNNFQDYQNNFVDSPPDSKEPWPVEYGKMHTTIASTSGDASETASASTAVTAVAVATAAVVAAAAVSQQQQHQQQHQQQQQQQQQQDNGGSFMSNCILPSRKRRMEWMSPQEDDNDGSETKIANIEKERDARRKGSMRWADDLDLDLTNELSSNGYISDSLLNFPVFKQELPSPPQKPQQLQLHQQQQQQQQQQSLQHQQAGPAQDHPQQAANGAASLQQQQQQQQETLGGNGANSNASGNGNGGNNHQQQQQQQQQQVAQFQQQHQQQGQGPMNGGPQGLMGNAVHSAAIGSGLSSLQNFLQSNRLDADTSGAVLQMQQDGTLAAALAARGERAHDDHNRFQYVLAAATSIATKNNEESLTYLNQGQSYEIKLKKLGDLSPFRGKILKSIIKICFHERRLQYMEREQMQLWQASRPGERILDVDIPLSYGLMQVQPTSSNLLNTIEVFWDPMKEVGVYVKVNCISTEFTPKKHGGEKGVPFRIQVETYIDSGNSSTGAASAGEDKDTIRPLHAAACQIKVFKLKGADRKHKQDREKILKRPATEQEKYQRSCDCTILSDISTDSVLMPLGGSFSPEHIKRNVSPLLGGPASPGQLNKFENIMSSVLCGGGANGGVSSAGGSKSAATTAAAMVVAAASAAAAQNNPIGISNVSSTNGLCKAQPMDQPMGGVLSPPQPPSELDDYVPTITKETSPGALAQWLAVHRLSAYSKTFAQFSGSDILRMSKEDLCKICGLADGIRMFNILHSKAITPRLTIYVGFEANIYHAIYLHSNTIPELVQNLSKIPGFLEAINALNNSASGSSEAAGLGGWSAPFGGRVSGGGSGVLKLSNGMARDGHLSTPSPTSPPISSSSSVAKLQLLINGPGGIQVLLTEDVLNNVKDETQFQLELKPNGHILMKAMHNTPSNNADCSIDEDGN